MRRLNLLPGLILMFTNIAAFTIKIDAVISVSDAVRPEPLLRKDMIRSNAGNIFLKLLRNLRKYTTWISGPAVCVKPRCHANPEYPE
jgi:hypothetical protein